MIRDEALKILRLTPNSDLGAIEAAFAARHAELSQKTAVATNPTLRAVYDLQAVKLREARDVLKAGLAARPSTGPIATNSMPTGLRPANPLAPMPTSIPGSPSGQTDLRNLPVASPLLGTSSFRSVLNQPPPQLGITIGQVLADRYEILSLLGHGGMGAVYSAQDRLRGEAIAIKVLLPHLLNDPNSRERFLNEAKIAGGLSHPNIVRVYDVQESDGLTFLTMELLKGRSLRDEMIRRGQKSDRFSIDEVLRISGQLCSALQVAHRVTVHRDVKPENVWLSDDGMVKLMDFGIARLLRPSQFTSTGMALGTAYYMAPEQLRGQEVDHRADQYAMGVMLYEMLTGEVPQGAIQAPRQVRKSVPAAMSEAVMKALAGDPQRRHADLAALMRAISSRSGLGLPSKLAIVAGVLLAIGAGATYRTWWPLLAVNAPAILNETAIPRAAADGDKTEESAKTAFPSRRNEVEAEKAEAETIVKQIEADGLNRKSDVAEKLAELWHSHPSRTRWIKEADGHLKSAIGEFDRGSYKQALADLETASTDYQRVKTWRQNARIALESVEKTRQELQAKLNALPIEAKIGLVDWPKKLAELVEKDIILDEAEEGKKVADRLASSLPEFDKLIGLRLSAVTVAKEAKLTENLDAYRDRYSSATRRIIDGDSELMQFKMLEARRIYSQTRDELVQLLHDESIDRAKTLIANARKLLERGNFQEAIKLFEEVRDIRPDDADPDLVQIREEARRGRLIAMIRWREQTGSPDSAAGFLVQLRDENPENDEVQAIVGDFIDRTIIAGKSARDNGRFRDAEDCYRRLKKLRPDSEIEQYVARVKQAERDAKDRAERIAAQKERERLARQKQAEAEAEERARRNDPARRGVGNPNSGTFGAQGVPAQGGGIYVSGTLPGSPAEASRLEAGDVIVSINGSAVNTQQEFVDAVHNSPDVMNFVVRDVRTGQRMSMSVRLNRPN